MNCVACSKPLAVDLKLGSPEGDGDQRTVPLRVTFTSGVAFGVVARPEAPAEQVAVYVCPDCAGELFPSQPGEFSVITVPTAPTRDDLDNAERLVAEMHAAALGRVQGPVYGVVDDVRDLRSITERMAAALRDAPHPPVACVERITSEPGGDAVAECPRCSALRGWAAFTAPPESEPTTTGEP